MAGVLWHVNSGECSLVAATPKSLLQIIAPTKQRVIIRALRFFGKQPAGGTDTPVKIRLTRSTANFGTFTVATQHKNDPWPRGKRSKSPAASPSSSNSRYPPVRRKS
jgi:hypothetical protein